MSKEYTVKVITNFITTALRHLKTTETFVSKEDGEYFDFLKEHDRYVSYNPGVDLTKIDIVILKKVIEDFNEVHDDFILEAAIYLQNGDAYLKDELMFDMYKSYDSIIEIN